jgi:hypothetical protein
LEKQADRQINHAHFLVLKHHGTKMAKQRQAVDPG